MQINVTVPPQFEPVTLEDCYLHLRLDAFGSPPEHPDDAMLLRHIESARADVERVTRRALVQQTLMVALPAWPGAHGCDRRGHAFHSKEYVELKRPPFIEMVSVQYFDTNNAVQDADAATYYIDDMSDIVPRLLFIGSMPLVYDRADAIRISWKAGYEPNGSPPSTQSDYAANVPANMKNAILLGVQLLYDQLATSDREALEKTQLSILGARVHNF